ncbi:Prophenoloxidase-I [Sesbania bispinosa]|nr:Prophenoloxidase-I [Sesbania bispinosa]
MDPDAAERRPSEISDLQRMNGFCMDSDRLHALNRDKGEASVTIGGENSDVRRPIGGEAMKTTNYRGRTLFV